MTPLFGLTADPLTSRVSRTWDAAYDDPTYRALVAELGIPGLGDKGTGDGRAVIVGEVISS